MPPHSLPVGVGWGPSRGRAERRRLGIRAAPARCLGRTVWLAGSNGWVEPLGWGEGLGKDGNDKPQGTRPSALASRMGSSPPGRCGSGPGRVGRWPCDGGGRALGLVAVLHRPVAARCILDALPLASVEAGEKVVGVALAGRGGAFLFNDNDLSPPRCLRRKVTSQNLLTVWAFLLEGLGQPLPAPGESQGRRAQRAVAETAPALEEPGCRSVRHGWFRSRTAAPMSGPSWSAPLPPAAVVIEAGQRRVGLGRSCPTG